MCVSYPVPYDVGTVDTVLDYVVRCTCGREYHPGVLGNVRIATRKVKTNTNSASNVPNWPFVVIIVIIFSRAQHRIIAALLAVGGGRIKNQTTWQL